MSIQQSLHLPKYLNWQQCTFMQPPTAQAQPKIGQSQSAPNFYKLCTPVGRKCWNSYILPNHPEWSDPEEEEEDWDR